MAVSISISITQNSQSVTNNTSNVTVKVIAKWTYGSYNKLEKSGWLTIDGTKYTFTSPFNTGQSTSGSVTLFSKTVNVLHKADGSKTLSCSASYTTGVSSGTVTASASKVLTTIPRKSTLSASNGTLGTQQTLTVTRQSTSFTHTITYTCGSDSGTICTKSTSTSISFVPPMDLAENNTTGTSVSIKFTITTYNGSTSLGSNTKTITCAIPDEVKPSCTLSVVDVTGYFEKYNRYIQNKSKFKIVITPVNAYKSPIDKYSTVAFGKSYTTQSFTTDVVPVEGRVSISTTVTDKRGRESNIYSTSINIHNYKEPSITKLAVHRCNADGTANDKGGYVQVVFTARLSSIDRQNSAIYTLKYKKSTENEYTAIQLTNYNGLYAPDDASYIFEADTGSSYDVRVEVQDDFTTENPVVRTTSVSTAFTLVHWLASGLGMAIGKIAELANVFDIGLQTRFSGGILHPILEPETDLNDVKTPNTYVGANLDTYNYANCPIEKGTFTLEVTGAGEEGQIKQRLTVCSKDKARTIERFYYQNSWGEWVCVSDFGNALLWSGGMYMQGTHEIALAEKISKQASGIVLVFSEYVDGEAISSSFHTRFIPKMMVSKHNGGPHTIQLSTSNLTYFATKHLYIYDDKIVGHDNNTLTITGNCGITATNKRFVLRYVIGV